MSITWPSRDQDPPPLDSRRRPAPEWEKGLLRRRGTEARVTATVAGGLAAHTYEGRGARGKGPHAARGPSGGGGAARARPSKKEMRARGGLGAAAVHQCRRARKGALCPRRQAGGQARRASRRAGGQANAGLLQGHVYARSTKESRFTLRPTSVWKHVLSGGPTETQGGKQVGIRASVQAGEQACAGLLQGHVYARSTKKSRFSQHDGRKLRPAI